MSDSNIDQPKALNTDIENLITPNGTYCRQLAPKAHVLYEPPDGSRPTIDLVFVHGLNSGEISCWQDDNNVMWPGCFIPQDFPTCRVLTVGYQSGMIKSEQGSDMNLLDPIVGTQRSESTFEGLPGAEGASVGPSVAAFTVDDCARVLHDTLLSPAVDVGGITSDVYGSASHRPVVFIVHSLGGLIVKQLLLDLELAEAETEIGAAVDSALLHSIKGIVCYSTPHFGSSVARYLNLADGPLLSAFQAASQALFPSSESRTRPSTEKDNAAELADIATAEASTNAPTPSPSAKVATIIRSLSDSNLLHLHRLNRHFLRIVTALQIPVLCFGEGERVRGLLKVVTQESSDPLAPYRDATGKLSLHPHHPKGEVINFSLFEYLVLEDKTHMYVNMPDDMNHLGYTRLKEYLNDRVIYPVPEALQQRQNSVISSQNTAAVEAAMKSIRQIWDEILNLLKAVSNTSVHPHKQVVVPSAVYAALEIAEELLAMPNRRLGTLLIIRFWIRELMFAVRAILSPPPIEPPRPVHSTFIPATELSRSVTPFELRRMRVLRESLYHCLLVLRDLDDPPLNVSQPMHRAFVFTSLVSLHQHIWDYRQAPHCISPLACLEIFDWGPAVGASQAIPVIPSGSGLDDVVARVVAVALTTNYPSTATVEDGLRESLFADPTAIATLSSFKDDDSNVTADKIIEQLLVSLDWDTPPPNPLADVPTPGAIGRAASALTGVLRTWGLSKDDDKDQSTESGIKQLSSGDDANLLPKPFERPLDKTAQQWQLNAHQITTAMAHWIACSVFGELASDTLSLNEVRQSLGEETRQLIGICVASMKSRRLEDESEHVKEVCTEPPACELVRAFLLQQTAAHEFQLCLFSRDHMRAMTHKTKTSFGAVTSRGCIHEAMAKEILDQADRAAVNVFIRNFPLLRTIWCDLHMYTFSMDVEVSLVQGTLTRLAKQMGIVRGATPTLLSGPFALALTYDKHQLAKPAVPAAIEESVTNSDLITAAAMREATSEASSDTSASSVWSWITSALSLGSSPNSSTIASQRRPSTPKEEISVAASEIGGAMYEPSVMGTEAASKLQQIMLPNTSLSPSDAASMGLWQRGQNTVRVQVPVHEEVYIRCKKVFGSAAAIVAHQLPVTMDDGRPVASLSLNRVVVDGGYIDPTDPSLAALQGRQAFIAGDYDRSIRFFRQQLDATERSRHQKPDSYLTPALANDPRVSLAWSYLGRAARARSAEGIRIVVEQMSMEGRKSLAKAEASHQSAKNQTTNSMWSVFWALLSRKHYPADTCLPIVRLSHKPILWGDALAAAIRPERVLIGALRELYSKCENPDALGAICNELDEIAAGAIQSGDINPLPVSKSTAADVHIAEDIFSTVLREAPTNVWSLCGKGRCLTMSLAELSSYNPSTDQLLHRQQQLTNNARLLTDAIQHFEQAMSISEGQCHYAAHFLGELGADIPKIRMSTSLSRRNGQNVQRDDGPTLPPFAYSSSIEPAPFVWCPTLTPQEQQFYTLSRSGWSTISACVKVTRRTMPKPKEEGFPHPLPPFYPTLPSLSYANRILEHFGLTSSSHSPAEVATMKHMLKPHLIRALQKEPRNVWGSSVLCLWAESNAEREGAKRQLMEALRHRLKRPH